MEPDNVPQELKSIPRWVGFTPDKIPMQANNVKASSTNPTTWSTFERACEFASTDGLAGVGFVFDGDGIVGIDLDACVNDGEPEPWALEVISQFDSYTEYSPSGNGIHIYCRGRKPVCSSKKEQVECYATTRYFTVTGNQYGKCNEIKECQAAINWLCRAYLNWDQEQIKKDKKQEKVGVQFDDQETARICLKLLLPWRADEYSEWVKIGMVLYSLNLYDAWVDFSKSSPKFDENKCRKKWPSLVPKLANISWLIAKAREDVGVDKVAEMLGHNMTPHRAGKIAAMDDSVEGSQVSSAASEISCIDLSTIKPQKVDWLWHPYIPRGMVSMLIGHPGVGKSTMLIDIVARVSTTGVMPDGQIIPTCKVGIGMVEDDLTRVTVPRLLAAGANLDNIKSLDGITKPNSSSVMPIKLPQHADRIKEFIEQHGIGLLVLDPITAYMGGSDNNAQQDVRDALQPLSKIAHQTNCAIYLTNHTSKGWKEQDAAFIGLGSVAFTAVSRVQTLLMREVDGDSRVLWITKSNIGIDSSHGGRSWNQKIDPKWQVPSCTWKKDAWPESLQEFLTSHKRTGHAKPPSEMQNSFNRILRDMSKANGGAVTRQDLIAACSAESIGEKQVDRYITQLNGFISSRKESGKTILSVKRGFDDDDAL